MFLQGRSLPGRYTRILVSFLLLTGLLWIGRFQYHRSARASVFFATITVTTTADENGTNPAACSLREAITAANTNAAFGGCSAGAAGLDTIGFNVGSGTPTINVSAVLGALPTITEAATIDGATGGATRIELNGAGLTGAKSGLVITAGGSTIQNLVINRFPAEGIILQTSGGNTVAGCYIGTDSAGAADVGTSRTRCIAGTPAARRRCARRSGIR